MKEWEGDVNTLWCFKHGWDSLSLNFCTRVMGLASICIQIPRMRGRNLNRRLRRLQIVCVKVCVCVRVQETSLSCSQVICPWLYKVKCPFCVCKKKKGPTSFKIWLWKEHVESCSALHTGHRWDNTASDTSYPIHTVDAAMCIGNTPSVCVYLNAVCVCLQGRRIFPHIVCSHVIDMIVQKGK